MQGIGKETTVEVGAIRIDIGRPDHAAIAEVPYTGMNCDASETLRDGGAQLAVGVEDIVRIKDVQRGQRRAAG